MILTREQVNSIKPYWGRHRPEPVLGARVPATFEQSQEVVLDLIETVEAAWRDATAQGELTRVAQEREAAATQLKRVCKGLLEHAEQECDLLKSELQAWQDGGVTEEMLRNSADGYIKVGRGCLLVSEHYLEEKDATIAALEAARDILNRQLAEVHDKLGYRGYP